MREKWPDLQFSEKGAFEKNSTEKGESWRLIVGLSIQPPNISPQLSLAAFIGQSRGICFFTPDENIPEISIVQKE